jgi:3-oxoacyl-[acyl-carrier protein] reductase
MAVVRQALVTGGTKGIGRAVALRLARAGHRVTCVYRQDETGRQACEAAAKDAGVPLAFERADLSAAADVADFLGRLAARKTEPAVLVNAAALSRSSALDAILLTCQLAARTMARAQFGRIVNVISAVELLGCEGGAADAAVQAGILGLTRALARELARSGVTVNVVSAGLVESAARLPPEQTAELVARTPLRRSGRPEEIAAAVAMVCDDLASYITGQCIAVDGGLT